MTNLDTLTADNERLRVENDALKLDNAMLKAHAAIDAERIKRLLAKLPVPPRRVWASI